MTSEGDIITALISIMKQFWGTGYRYYTKELTEGYTFPCFFIDVYIAGEQPQGANTVRKDVECVIEYYQETRDQELTVDVLDGLRVLLLQTDRRHLILPVGEGDAKRFLPVKELALGYVGQSNNIPQITFSLEFNDSYAVKDETDLMQNMDFQLQIGGNEE